MLEELLKKPESFRRRVAYGVTAAVGVVIVAFWLAVTSYSFKQSLKESPTESDNAEQFRQSLPTLRQTESIQTELEKKTLESAPAEEE